MPSIRRVMIASGLTVLLASASALAQDATPDKDAPNVNPAADQPAPPSAQPPAPTPPYSKDITGEEAPERTVAKDVNVTVQPTPPPAPAPTTTIVTPPPAPAAALPQPVVVESKPVHVTVVEPRQEAGLSVSLGGGLGEFTDATLRDRTGVSGEYEARLQLGTRSPIAAEAAYVGTAGSINALGLDDNAMLISNGVEGLARLNLGTRELQPFAVGGVSWVRYNIVNSRVNTSDVRNQDDVFAVPVGAGLATYMGDSGFMADVRFMYRFTFNDDLIRPTPTNSTGASLANWNVSLRLGYAF